MIQLIDIKTDPITVRGYDRLSTELTAETIIDKDSDYIFFTVKWVKNTFKIPAGKSWSNPDIRREVLHELYPNWNKDDGYWQEREQIDNLTDKDYLKFINQNKARWEVEHE